MRPVSNIKIDWQTCLALHLRAESLLQNAVCARYCEQISGQCAAEEHGMCDSAFADTISALGNAPATIGVCTWRARVVHIFRLNFKEKQESADGGGLQAAATQAQWACRRFVIASFGYGDAPNPLRACALETPSRTTVCTLPCPATRNYLQRRRCVGCIPAT